MQWADGPLTPHSPLRNGYVLLVNEIDAMEPSERVGLQLWDASPCPSRRPAKPSGRTTSSVWSPPATAPGAVTAAACTKACCGRTWALLDRFRLMEVGYPEPAEEMQSWPGPCRPCRPPWRTRWSKSPTKSARSSSAARTVLANCRSPCPHGACCAGRPWLRPSRVRRTPSPIPWDKHWLSAPNPPSARQSTASRKTCLVTTGCKGSSNGRV